MSEQELQVRLSTGHAEEFYFSRAVPPAEIPDFLGDAVRGRLIA